MKKILTKLAGCLMCFMLFSFSAAAEDSLQITQWYGDYENTKLIVNIESLVNYVQRVTAVMYPKNSENSIDNYKRMTEVTLNGKGEAVISFVIADDLDAANGEYTVSLQGSGYLGSNATQDVVIVRPSSDLLSRFNSATLDNLDGYITEANLPLQLNAGTSPRDSVRLQKFLNIRKYDYNNSFSSLEKVKDAWTVSDVIAYLAGSSIDKDTLKAKIEANIAFFTINTTDEDYITYADNVYNTLLTVGKTYNNGIGIQSATDLSAAFKGYLALNVINGASWEDIEADITSYYSDLGITETTFNKFKNFALASRQMVLRQIHEKNFTEPELIKSAFDSGVSAVEEELGDTNPPADPPSNNGGGSGGGPYGIASDKNSDDAAETKNGDFPDCNSSHWAYTYVNNLREKNIVSGYQDGNFYPGKNVTREEFVKMIISAVGLYNKDAQCEFEDVLSSAWYYTYVASAQTENIVQGVGENVFGIGNNLTREDAAVIAARILERFNKAGSTGNIEFTDNDSISEYALDSIKLLSGMNILNGFEDASFRPKAFLTRAETAKIIYMLRELI